MRLHDTMQPVGATGSADSASCKHRVIISVLSKLRYVRIRTTHGK